MKPQMARFTPFSRSGARTALVGAAALALALSSPLLAQTGQSGTQGQSQGQSQGQAPAGGGQGQPGQPNQRGGTAQPGAAQMPAQSGQPAARSGQTRQTQGQAQGQQRLSRAEMRFVTQSMQGNMAEVNMGQIARQNGQSEEVKRFGEMLATDHGRANDMLQQIAGDASGINVPQQPTRKQQREAARFERMQGADFDRAFARHMAEEHRKEIEKYRRMARGDGPVADYANATLPDLEKHLETAQSIAGAQGGQRRR